MPETSVSERLEAIHQPVQSWYLRGMNPVLGCDLLHCPITTKRLKRHCGFKLIRKFAPLGHFYIQSLLLNTP